MDVHPPATSDEIARVLIGYHDELCEKHSKYGSLAPVEVEYLIACLFEIACLYHDDRGSALYGSARGMWHHRNATTRDVSERQPLRPRERFAILRRDDYTCQYCGGQAPMVRLEVDHVLPVSQGGTNHPDNLRTACWECNRGKAAASHVERDEE